MLNLTEIASRIKQPELCSSQDIDSLKTLCETYPYSQIFPLLYLKTLAQTNDVRLDQELQRFAYRIADRTVLYDLLNSKSEVDATVKNDIEIVLVPNLEERLEEEVTSSITNSELTINTNEIDSINQGSAVEIIEPKNEIVVVEATEEVIEEPVNNELTEDKVINQVDEEISDITLTDETVEENSIENILSEEITPEEDSFIEESVLPTLPDELLQSLNLGSEVYSLEAEESKISKEKELEQEKIAEEALEFEKKKLIEALTQRKPLIEQVKEEKVEAERSFTGWLKQNSTHIEETEEIKEKADSGTLIEQFIQNDPKISQQKEKLFEDRTDKNELFNPMTKAKESLDDTQLPVSETLAKIFAAQGNFPKAIYAYQQLMLIFPEKKVFFASQIEELNKKINI